MFVLHEGPEFPGPDRRHLLQTCDLFSGPGIMADCAVWTVSIEAADKIIHFLARNPNIIQDLCRTCHPTRRVPNRARWNIYRGQEPRTIVPCYIEDWF